MGQNGGGIWIAAGVTLGAVIGIIAGNGAIGMIAGFAAGGALAWVLARRDDAR